MKERSGIMAKTLPKTSVAKQKTKVKQNSTFKALHRRENLTLWAMAIPGIVFTFLFKYLPMPGLVMAFKNYIPSKGIWGSEWCGWDNFEFFFTSSDALRTLGNTVFYSMVFIFVDIVCGVTVGILLFTLKSNLGRKVYNTIMILPRFMSMVLIAYVVYGLLAYNGVVNTVLGDFGIEAISFYEDPKYWPVILTLVHIWASVGMKSIMYLAQLSSVDTSLTDAARIDGATKFQVAWNVYVPHLYPIISILLILAIGDIFTGDFGLFYQVPKNLGALYPTTDIIPTYVYRGLTKGKYAVSTAIGLFQSVAGCIMTILANLVVKKIDPDNSLF